MGTSVDIVKRSSRRGTESFKREKLHASIVATCLSLHTPIGQAEKIAQAVCDDVHEWLQDKSEVTSHDIRTVTAKHLHTHHPDAAYMYKQYVITI